VTCHCISVFSEFPIRRLLRQVVAASHRAQLTLGRPILVVSTREMNRKKWSRQGSNLRPPVGEHTNLATAPGPWIYYNSNAKLKETKTEEKTICSIYYFFFSLILSFFFLVFFVLFCFLLLFLCKLFKKFKYGSEFSKMFFLSKIVHISEIVFTFTQFCSQFRKMFLIFLVFFIFPFLFLLFFSKEIEKIQNLFIFS